MSEKTFFASTDYRNAKYQGAIKDGSPDGLALFFDHQHLFSLSNFKKDVPYGPTLIVFPNRDYLYGKIKNKILQSICVFVKASGQSYVLDFVNGQSNKIVYSDNNNIVIQFFEKDGRLKIGETKSCREKGSQKWNTISAILGKQIPQYFRSCKSYVKETFQRQFQDVVQLSEISGLTFLGFRNTPSLGIKLSKDDRVQQVGYFQLFPRNLEFGRKYLSDSLINKVQEGRFIQPEKIFTYQTRQQRTIEASRYTEEYFKRGTNFKNSFYKVPLFEEIFKYLQKIQKQVSCLEFVQFGQKILQVPEEKRSEEDELSYKNKQYTIEEVKKQILAAVKRKNLGGKRGSSALQISRQNQRTSRQKIGPYNKASFLNQKTQLSPLNRGLSKQKRYVYSQKIAVQPQNGRLYVQMSQKRQSRGDYSPKPDYYPNSQKKVLSEFRNISPGNETYRYQDRYINNNYQRQKVSQEILLEKAKRHVSPLRQRAITAYSQSPYERIRQIRIPQKQDNPPTIRVENFNIAKTTDEMQYNNYLKYKNRNKKPVIQSKSPYKPQIGHIADKQIYKQPLIEKKVLLNGDFLETQPQKQKELVKKDLILPARYKKQFKYF